MGVGSGGRWVNGSFVDWGLGWVVYRIACFCILVFFSWALWFVRRFGVVYP